MVPKSPADGTSAEKVMRGTLGLLQLAGAAAALTAGMTSSRRPPFTITFATGRGNQHRTTGLTALQQSNAPRDPYDWRQFRAQMVRASRETDEPPDADAAPMPPSTWWVHELAAPEPGCVLLDRKSVV